ncbi:hypothetical protein DCAR_0934631 [Daucus carota subsp. sativus]|uniref:RING-CH-type domain-containing protein n=1 Tax=Daucus carota subsp. sativus TaxID=79200 RepID=A0AAF1BCX4_DAUCS|nr:PREDICTED: uncharacterized protein LOC108203004 isoform X1 [Daucus carota subsp. sativus]XP_017227168.1 PREDICTED: uncharacterized protein LOC108203004 isoform X1 [Daucus carota subsp. sativus]WOH15094.1 hypothetical protein DCAR_0934631 [Daucus carota subsp. sativus]
MADHLTLCVDQLVPPESLQSPQKVDARESTSSSFPIDIDEEGDNSAGGEEEPLIQTVECRICQEEDSINNLEVPCSCNGSVKFAHRKCVQRWCNEKGDITCEICNQPYQSGYTAPSPRAEDTTIDISGAWTIAGSPLDLHDPRLLAMAAAERQLLEAEYDQYNNSDANGAAFCRVAALILMALLLLRHALTMGDSDSDDDDASTFFALFLLRAAGFLIPCYIMAWAISVLQRRRQRQEAAALAAASDLAFLVQTGRHRGLQVTIAAGAPITPAPASTPGPALNPHQEPIQ